MPPSRAVCDDAESPPPSLLSGIHNVPGWVGKTHAVWLRSEAPTCGLSKRSCVFGDMTPSHSCMSSFNAPVRPAPGSVCPALAFALPATNGSMGRCARKTAATAPTSVGSPSAVPVPWASSVPTASAARRASAREALSTPCCACPLGAVRLADRPSCRTALPSTPSTTSSLHSRQAIATMASPRAYPSARTSKVCDRPRTDVKPATALPRIVAGSRIMFTPALSAKSHSSRCSARTLPWLATSDAEQAVSYDAHGPCRPNTKETRPHVTEHEEPVDAYTLRPAGVRRSTLANSLCHWPTFAAATLPMRPPFVTSAAWNAPYPRSSSCRCCGSIADASAAEVLKKLCSKSSALRRKLPCRTRLLTSGGLLCRSFAASSTSHRENGITHSKSCPQWLALRSASRLDTLLGSATLVPAIST
mmetsp:Transcript_61162/g.121028  ORF Transcript_61162/g.121028 Transcript_61162/m.121028 type:complete len:418 (+) Transcript_61162:5475-6728(+)